MKPLDPRLVRTAGAVRTHLAVSVASGVLITGLILAQAWLLARVITGAWAGEGLDALGWMVAAVAAAEAPADLAAASARAVVLVVIRRSPVSLLGLVSLVMAGT